MKQSQGLELRLSGGNQQVVPLVAPVDGFVYAINVEVGDTIESFFDVWIEDRGTRGEIYQPNGIQCKRS